MAKVRTSFEKKQVIERRLCGLKVLDKLLTLTTIEYILELTEEQYKKNIVNYPKNPWKLFILCFHEVLINLNYKTETESNVFCFNLDEALTPEHITSIQKRLNLPKYKPFYKRKKC